VKQMAGRVLWIARIAPLSEMADYRVRGYKNGKLWTEFEEAVYSETSPGKEQQGIATAPRLSTFPIAASRSLFFPVMSFPPNAPTRCHEVC